MLSVSGHDSGIIAAGQKWVDDAERNLEKDKWRLQRAADADWEKKVEPLLTSAYLDVERVAAAADVLREHMMRKTSTEVTALECFVLKMVLLGPRKVMI